MNYAEKLLMVELVIALIMLWIAFRWPEKKLKTGDGVFKVPEGTTHVSITSQGGGGGGGDGKSWRDPNGRIDFELTGDEMTEKGWVSAMRNTGTAVEVPFPDAGTKIDARFFQVQFEKLEKKLEEKVHYLSLALTQQDEFRMKQQKTTELLMQQCHGLFLELNDLKLKIKFATDLAHSIKIQQCKTDKKQETKNAVTKRKNQNGVKLSKKILPNLRHSENRQNDSRR